MPLINCNRNNTCGQILSSSCVDYNGPTNQVIKQDELCCNPSIDDVFILISNKIQEINNKIDLSTFNKKCLSFDKNTQSLKDLEQQQTDLLCTLKSELEALTLKVNGLNASNLTVTLDLGCLKPVASPCLLSTDTYTIYSVLNIFKNEICSLKNP